MNPTSPSTSLTLLAQLRQRDQPDAWERFVQLYRPLLHTWAKRQGFQDADADDLTHEVLIKLMGALPHYVRGEKDSFRGWLYRLTANQCRDFCRRVATRPLPGADGLSGVPEEPVLGEFEETQYRKALIANGLKVIKDEFEANTWMAFEQTRIQNRETKEVATELGMTPAAIYSAQSRILARLRDVIAEFLD
jgi:RNA polymerase sigma factor (sigma-70 family)